MWVIANFGLCAAAFVTQFTVLGVADYAAKRDAIQIRRVLIRGLESNA